MPHGYARRWVGGFDQQWIDLQHIQTERLLQLFLEAVRQCPGEVAGREVSGELGVAGSPVARQLLKRLSRGEQRDHVLL